MYPSGNKWRKPALVSVLAMFLCLVPFCGIAGTPADGVLSAYIVGTYDNGRDSLSTVIQVINPTYTALEIIAYFFDADENFLRCVRTKLSHDDMVEIAVQKLELKAEAGVVKIVAFKPGTTTPQIGIVGYKRTFVLKTFAAETVLHQVPVSVLMRELPGLLKSCPAK